MYQADIVAGLLARQQYGGFARWQLRDAGVSESAIGRRAGTTWLVPHRGVYALASHPSSWTQRLMLATLVDPLGVAGGLSAAALWGVGGVEPSSIEITLPPGHRPRLAHVFVRHSGSIQRRVHRGIPVNAPELVVLELAARLPARQLGAVIDDLVVGGLTRVDRVGDALVRAAPGRPRGARLLRAVLRERGAGYVPPESELERRLFEVLRAPGIPPLRRQSPFPWRPELARRVDARVLSWPVLVEGDGRPWHSRLEQMAADRARDREALAHGYLVVRYTWGELVAEPECCARHLLDIGARWAHLAA
jgi:hypothetical protein